MECVYFLIFDGKEYNMSRRLIKNKTESKELQYYKNHCELLEKELEEERKKRTNLEITLSLGTEPSNQAASELQKLIKMYTMAKNTQEKLISELLVKKKEMDEILAEIHQIKPLYIDKCEKEYDKILGQYTRLVKFIE